MKSSLDNLELSVGSFSSDELPTVDFKKCLVGNCRNRQHGRKLCRLHYMSWWRYGDPLITMGVRYHYLNDAPERNVWQHMKQRCNNPKNKSYADYGGRGIKVCERWSKLFINFYKDMGPRPSDKHSIERMNNNGNYEPGNCRWAIKDDQVNNYRHNRFITIGDRTQSLKRWVDEFGLNYGRVHRRLQRGWSEKRALEIERN